MINMTCDTKLCNNLNKGLVRFSGAVPKSKPGCCEHKGSLVIHYNTKLHGMQFHVCTVFLFELFGSILFFPKCTMLDVLRKEILNRRTFIITDDA